MAPEAHELWTGIELLLYKEFRKLSLCFDSHKPMFGRWICDFVFEKEKIIVEAEGDYWSTFPTRNPYLLSETAEANGWTILHFSEAEINRDAAGCARTVARFIGSKEM